MDISNVGSNVWIQPGASAPVDSVNAFLEDTNKNKLANSIGDLLQLTRSRHSRQFVDGPAQSRGNLLSTSVSTSALKPITSVGETREHSPMKGISPDRLGTGYSGTGGGNTTGNGSRRAVPRRLSSNPSRNPPPGASYTIQERPPSKLEIDALEVELSERLRTISDLAKAELQAVETGQMYQPHKDALILARDRILKEFEMNEECFHREHAWMDKLVKCESLKHVCEGVASQLVDMVSVTSTGLGNVLRKLKYTYKQSFEQMKDSWIELHDSYIDNTDELREKTIQLESVRADLNNLEEEMRQKVEAKIEQLTNEFENEKQRDKEQLIATEFQVEQMTETLKSLNGIFKTMQADGSAINASDLAFKCERLEKELEVLSSQCMTLDKVKNELTAADAKLIHTERQLAVKDAELSGLRLQLQKREDMVTALMEKESLRNSEIEKLQKLVAEQSNQEELDDFEEPPTSVLCIRCKKSLDDLGNIRAAIYGSNASSERVQCESFRILLPNLRGKQPHRTIAWVRYCMRGVLISKMKEDVNLLGLHGNLSRFPEYVYSWFERYGVGRGALNANAPQQPQIQQNSDVMQLMDDDRWGLYYGAKALAKDDPEAKLFWALLDESYGEDGLQFVMHCMSTILSMGGAELWKQFGNVLQETNKYGSAVTAFSSIGMSVSEGHHGRAPLKKGPGSSHAQDPSLLMSMGGGTSSQGSGFGGGHPVLKDKYGEIIAPLGRARIYVDAKVSVEAVRRIMTKGGQSMQQALDAITALSITPEVADPLVLRPSSPKNTAGEEDEKDDKADQEPHVPVSKEPTHICLFTWLRIMLQRYTDDQAHRTASINTMFEAASIGALTPQLPATHVQGNEVIGAKKSGNSIEFPQFQSVCRTLHPFVSIAECASLFTATYYEGDRHVTPKAFIKIADTRGLFSRALRLAPLPLLAEHAPADYAEIYGGKNTGGVGTPSEVKAEKERRKEAQESGKLLAGLSPGLGYSDENLIRMHVGCLVHRRLASAMPAIIRLINELPEKWRVLLTEIYYQASDSLNDYKQTGKNRGKKGQEFGVTQRHGHGHGHRAGAGAMAGAGSPGSGGGGGGLDGQFSSVDTNQHVAFHVDGIQPLVAYRKLLSIALLLKALNDNPILPSNLLTNSYVNVLPTLSVNLVKVDKLLGLLERALQVDEAGEHNVSAFEEARRSIMVRKLQLVFRAFVATNPPVPRSVRFVMRPGYLRATRYNMIKRRLVIQDPWWTQSLIAEIYTYKLNYDMKASRLGHAHISFQMAIAACLYDRFGCLEVSERAIHDIFMCIKSYHYCLPRLRMFGAFVGVGSLEEPVLSILQTKEAVALYLDLLVRVHHEHDLHLRNRIKEARMMEHQLQDPVALDMDATAEDAAAAETAEQPVDLIEEVEGYSRTAGLFHIPYLFPTSERDPTTSTEKKDTWGMEAVVLEQVAVKWASSALLHAGQIGPSGGSGVWSDSAAFGQLVYKLKIDRHRCAEVDDFLWLLMLQWAKITSLYTKKSSIKAAWIERNKKPHDLIVKKTSAFTTTNPAYVIPFGSHQLFESFQAVYGNSGVLPDTHRAAQLYIEYACCRNFSKIPNIDSLMMQSTIWDTATGGGGVASAMSVAGSVTSKPQVKTPMLECVHRDTKLSQNIYAPHPHYGYLNEQGYDNETIQAFLESGDNLLPHRLMINIHASNKVAYSIQVIKKSFAGYQTPITDAIAHISKMDHKDQKQEVDRVIHLARKNLLHLEHLLECVPPLSDLDEPIDMARELWIATANLHGTIEELVHMTNMPYPQDPAGSTRKLHLERSAVFSIITAVGGV